MVQPELVAMLQGAHDVRQICRDQLAGCILVSGKVGTWLIQYLLRLPGLYTSSSIIPTDWYNTCLLPRWIGFSIPFVVRTSTIAGIVHLNFWVAPTQPLSHLLISELLAATVTGPLMKQTISRSEMVTK